LPLISRGIPNGRRRRRVVSAASFIVRPNKPPRYPMLSSSESLYPFARHQQRLMLASRAQ
jgi:hypothetical protein